MWITAAGPDISEGLVDFVRRHRVRPAIEPGRELEWEKDRGNVENHPSNQTHGNILHRQPDRKNIKPQEITMRKKPQHNPTQHKLNSIHIPRSAKSPYSARGAETTDEGIGEGDEVAVDNDAVRVETGVHFEGDVQPVDGAEVEEFLDDDQNNDQRVINCAGTLSGGLQIDAGQDPGVGEHRDGTWTARVSDKL